MNHVRIKGAEQNIEIAGATPVMEVLQHDSNIVRFVWGHILLLPSVLRCTRVMRGT
jgi:hypothetical protein